MSRYFNEVGEPLMTAAQARLEDELDEMSRYEPVDEYDRDRLDGFWEDLYEQQHDGACPACGEENCEDPIKYDFDVREAHH